MIITEQELHSLAKKFKLYAKFWLVNPLAFVYQLGIANVLPYQAECLKSVVENKRTIVRSGHGAGKTFIMCIIAIWWLCLHWVKGRGCSVIVTSPSSPNLKTVFWPQFSNCLNLLPRYLRDHFVITVESAYQIEDNLGWRIDLRTARKENPESMAGQHNVLYLIDEFSGVPQDIYEVIEGAMSDEGSRIFAIGNPLRAQGWGYDAFYRDKKLWNTLHIDCSLYESHKQFTTIWTDFDDVEHEDVNYGRVVKEENEKWLYRSAGNVDGIYYRIRVRGEFPLQATNQFISQAHARTPVTTPAHKDQEVCHMLGLDPATTGDDDIALVHRWGANVITIKTWQEEDTRKIAYQTKDWIKKEGSEYQFKTLSIDAIGDGKGVYDSLMEMHQRGEIKNLETVTRYKASYEAADNEQYDRLRDESWDMMKTWLINKNPSFPQMQPEESNILAEELIGPCFDFNNLGRMKVESKKDMKKRGIRSPNIADALSMTFYISDQGYVKKKLDRYQHGYYNESKPINWRAI